MRFTFSGPSKQHMLRAAIFIIRMHCALRGLIGWLCMIFGAALSIRRCISPWKHNRPILSRSASLSMLPNSYLAVHVTGKLTEESYDRFYEHTLTNARNSILEAGISRFDVLRNAQNPSEFLLVEVYKSSDDPDKHKQTQHYKDWRVAVEPMMAQPRSALKFNTIFPHVKYWDTPEASSKDNPQHYQQQRPWLAEPFQHFNDGTKGGILAQMIDLSVQKTQESAFLTMIQQWVGQTVLRPVAHRVDLLANCANADTLTHSHFRLVLMQNSAQEALWDSEIATAVRTMLTAPVTTATYTTLFPSPLYYHQHSALTYDGEGRRFVQAQLQQEHQHAEWSGLRGLATTNIAAGAFSFHGPKVVMGRGIAASAVRDALKTLGLKRPLVVTGAGGLQRQAELFEQVFPEPSPPPPAPGGTSSHAPYHYTTAAVSVSGEPTVEDAQRLCAFAVAQGCDSVLAVGGGSALDVGKAVAALIPNSHRDVWDFLEVIGKGLPLENTPLPLIAVPTTSGTGSEATKNAVLKSVKHGLKVSIRHEKMYPAVAVLDPLLTLTCPPAVTAHVGMDTLCQCLEPYICCVPNPFVDALAKEGITRAARSLRDAVADGKNNVEAREDLAVASVMGGMCLANAKLGAVHGFAAVLGGRYEHAPHGALCAALLPFVFEENVRSLRALVAEGGTKEAGRSGGGAGAEGNLNAMVRLARFEEVARLITGNPCATTGKGVSWLHALMRDINIPRLGVLCPELQRVVEASGRRGGEGGSCGGTAVGGGSVPTGDAVTAAAEEAEAELQAIITATMNASSTKGNPIVLTREQLLSTLLRAL